MASRSNVIESTSSTHYNIPSFQKAGISACSPRKIITNLSVKSKCAAIAFTIGSIVGIIIIALGLAQICGQIGSSNFILAMTTGYILTVVSIIGLVWIAVTSCKTREEPQTESSISGAMKNRQSNGSDIGILGRPQVLREEDVIASLATQFENNGDISACLKGISPDFFDEKSQERAKRIFPQVMKQIVNSDVDFPKACFFRNPESLVGSLDKQIFQLSATMGVENDIPRSSKDRKHLHVYQVASQYNASEAPSPKTPPIGEAMQRSEWDHTQGPLAQRTNPDAFELVTAFLTHLGFNMLDAVLPSAGKTYEEGAPIEHGYLRPNDENIQFLTDEFKKNYSQAEYVCYSSFSKEWGGVNPVYLFLQAAPAIGYAHGLNTTSDDLQKYAAFANYLALFNYGIELAKKTGKEVILHPTAVGGGVFNNSDANLAWGFEKAGLALQTKMKSAGVFVQLEAFQGAGVVKMIGSRLKIPFKARIGD